MQNFTNDQLHKFIHKASLATYVGGGSYEKVVERPGFLELIFQDGDWCYRDSYAGFYRSSGSEVVRFKNQVVWVSSYCGGMVTGFEKLADQTFDFLKQSMLAKPDLSFRGPDDFKYGDWEYRYHQIGDVAQFTGHEEINYQGKLVFFHDIIGGKIIDK